MSILCSAQEQSGRAHLWLIKFGNNFGINRLVAKRLSYNFFLWRERDDDLSRFWEWIHKLWDDSVCVGVSEWWGSFAGGDHHGR